MRALLPLLAAAALAACAPMAAPPEAPAPLAFEPAEFAWSTTGGPNAVEGSVTYSRAGAPWTCAGTTVGLTPDTPYSRQRISVLYGSTLRALLPVREVRSRTVAEAGADYSRFVRRAPCDAQGRFAFRGLPDGAWFVIANVRPASGAAAEDALVLMQRVEARNGITKIVLLQ